MQPALLFGRVESGQGNSIAHLPGFQGETFRLFLRRQFARCDIQQNCRHTRIPEVRGDLRPHRSRSQNRSFSILIKFVWYERPSSVTLRFSQTPLNWPSKGL